MQDAKHNQPGWLTFIIPLCFMVLFGLCAITQGQATEWDLLHYHFYIGYAFIHHRMGFDIMPAGEQTYLNPFLDVLNYLLILTQRPIVSVFLKGAVAGLNGFMLYKISALLFRHESRQQRLKEIFFAITIGVTGAAGMTVLGSFTNDVEMTLLVMIALYCLIQAFITTTARPQQRYIAIAGLLMGMDVGLKLVATSYAIGLVVALLLSLTPDRRRPALVMLFVVMMLAGFICTGGYWTYHLYSEFQNPVFPYFNDIFRSSAIEPLRITTENVRTHYFTMPYYLALGESEMGDYRDARLLVLALIAGIALLKRTLSHASTPGALTSQPLWRFLLIFFIVSYVVWYAVFTDYRYFLPLELLSGLLIVYFTNPLLTHPRESTLLLTLLTLFLCTHTQPLLIAKKPFEEHYFSVSAPRLPPHATVLVASPGAPYSIPFFQPDTRFVGLPFIKPMQNVYSSTPTLSRLQEKVARLLKNNTADTPVYVLKTFTIYNLIEKRGLPLSQGVTPRASHNWQLSSTDKYWHLHRFNEQWNPAEDDSRLMYHVLNTDEVDGLESFLAPIPKGTLFSNFSAAEKITFARLLQTHEKRFPRFDPDRNLRIIYYRYVLVKDSAHCQPVATSIAQILVLCPLIRGS